MAKVSQPSITTGSPLRPGAADMAMRYQIRHETRYDFESEVFLEPHAIRLRPRDGAGQRLVRYAIAVHPTPAATTEVLDLHGNAVTYAWFDGRTESLTIDVDFEVETTRINPFDFLLLPAGGRPLPWPPDSEIAGALVARDPSPSPEVTALATGLSFSASGVVGFLSSLAAHLSRSLAVDIREFGDPMPPGQTLAGGGGSCRDLAVLFVDACRAVGIPARFVSGYQEGDPGQERRDMHAWAEAYVPGGGWRGFDPTHGMAVADRHIAVAAAAHPRDAAPVTGTYRGRARQTLSHRIELAQLG